MADRANEWMGAITSALDGPAGWFKDVVTYGLLNPLQSLLAESPWWLAFAGLLGPGGGHRRPPSGAPGSCSA